MLARVEKTLAEEPEHDKVPFEFSHVVADRRPMTIFRFIAPYWLPLTLALVLVIFEIIAQQIGPLLTQISIDKGIMQKDLGMLIMVGMVYMGSVLVNGLAGYARIAWAGRVGERLMLAMRLRVFMHLQRLSMDFFTAEMGGRLMARMTSDIEALSILFHEGLLNLLLQGLTLVFVTIILFSLNAKLAAVMVFVVVPIMTLLTIWFRVASDKGYGIVRERIADVLADFQESLTGIRVITSLNRQYHNIIHHRNVLGEYRDSNTYTARISALYSSGSDIVSVCGQIIILLVGGRMLLNGDLSIGELSAFILYLTTFFAPIQQLVQLYNTYQSGQAAMAKLRELLLTEPSVPEKADARELPAIEGEITLNNVTFSYTPGQVVLKNLDLSIKAGETLALVGETGAGKSTIAKLIIRFYDPDEGEVLIDGHNLTGVSFESLRSQLGYVPQEPFLFAGTIRDNIAFTRPDSTDEEVMDACRAVGIDDLIKLMPEGVNTIVHERGASLSSGERQLLALARAFIAKPRVLVLDEATSNLDLASESKIERALNVLLEGRTAILIAHRLTTAMKADRIAMVHDHRIVELGSHAELLALNGQYADLYATWVRHSESAEHIDGQRAT
ncbi:MAG: ABC transporter ATP-binding protein [Deltaproteobacteria bacterium]|nr:ABC transporter ATP-binding protein [Deltaproteobacteria bacterium]